MNPTVGRLITSPPHRSAKLVGLSFFHLPIHYPETTSPVWLSPDGYIGTPKLASLLVLGPKMTISRFDNAFTDVRMSTAELHPIFL
jgi:hypothetical protein